MVPGITGLYRQLSAVDYQPILINLGFFHGNQVAHLFQHPQYLRRSFVNNGLVELFQPQSLYRIFLALRTTDYALYLRNFNLSHNILALKAPPNAAGTKLSVKYFFQVDTALLSNEHRASQLGQGINGCLNYVVRVG